MERVGGTSLTAKSFENSFTNNTAEVIKKLNEYSAESLDYEEQLNDLRLSNITRLGTLRKKQEKEVLDAALHANDEIFKKRVELQEEALEEEKAARLKALESEDELTIKLKLQQIEDEFKERKKHIQEQAAWEKKNKEKDLKQEAAKAKRDAIKKGKEYRQEQVDSAFGKGKSLGERKEGFQNLLTGIGKANEDGSISALSKGKAFGAGIASLSSALSSALSNFAKQLESQMDEIAGKKSAIDTRLQGSANKQRMGSYWDQMSANITGIAGISPLVKQSAITARVEAMVGQGIAFNVEQRATLDVLKDKIATTFDAANGTLLRLVKIQQQDTTAGRLGMESALTAFLNNMYETTEYMQNLASSVKGSLEEAMSLMTGENALSFEYQIQKWLGSLSSVGMSDPAVQGLAGVLGQVASGKLEGITGGGQGNLVIMAANNAGLNISDILSNGLTQESTNALMNSMVDYLGKIYAESGNSKVIQQQIASVYGLSASDLKAAVNLSKSRATVAKEGLDYDSAMGRLYSMASTMGQRTSTGEILSNMWDNVKYSMAAGIANNPVTYGLYKMSGLLKDTTGGINFGLPLVMGTGMPIAFNVADLMRAGALGGGIMSSLGSMITSGGNGGLTGLGILRAAGISDNAVTISTRGTGLGLSTVGGLTVSESGSMIGNSDSSDITNKTMTDQTDAAKADTVSAVDESEETKLKDVDTHIMGIIDILRSIQDGSSILSVKVDGEVKVAGGYGTGL